MSAQRLTVDEVVVAIVVVLVVAFSVFIVIAFSRQDAQTDSDRDACRARDGVYAELRGADDLCFDPGALR